MKNVQIDKILSTEIAFEIFDYIFDDIKNGQETECKEEVENENSKKKLKLPAKFIK